ncbi:hypothetical protein C8R44DRAFT_742026 [Mycena epipterygia]|nr:hypothetical protein C8R44DRAFT_742026 [Mycena epipterygia]
MCCLGCVWYILTDDGVQDIARIRTARAMDSGGDKLQTQVVGVVVDVDAQVKLTAGFIMGWRNKEISKRMLTGLKLDVCAGGGAEAEPSCAHVGFMFSAASIASMGVRVSTIGGTLSLHSTIREETRDSGSASHRHGKKRREDAGRSSRGTWTFEPVGISARIGNPASWPR